MFLVALARIGYALTQSKPAGLHPDLKLETLLAEVVHWLLYISLVVVPLSGWIHHSAAAIAAPIWIPFAQSLPFVPTDPTVFRLFRRSALAVFQDHGRIDLPTFRWRDEASLHR